MAELRWNPFRGEWVAMAPARQDRTFFPPAESCPFCPSASGGPLTEVPVAQYQIAVLRNRFPPMRPDAPDPGVAPMPWAPVRPAEGVCEVVLYHSRHDYSLAQASLTRLQHIVAVWRDRAARLGALPFVQYVYVFENRGAAVGVTLDHPHGQIYAYPFIPPVVEQECARAAAHLQQTGHCLSCAVLADERAAGRRVIAENDRFTILSPFAARFPFEIHIMAREHVANLTDFDRETEADLARALGAVIRAYDRLFDAPMPYMMALRQAPTDGRPYPALHFRIEFMPLARTATKLKYLAGSESGAGVFITDMVPEVVAERVRAALDPTWQLRSGM